MSKEKQIEEMAKVLESTCDETECNHPTNCDLCQATRLYNADYRKQSEVAREIFEDMEKMARKYPINHRINGITSVEFVRRDYEELKKKYTEVENGA